MILFYFFSRLFYNRWWVFVYLHDQVVATLAEAFQHAQEEVCGLHQVLEEGLGLLGVVKLPEQRQEQLPVLHQVEDVAWRAARGHTGTTTGDTKIWTAGFHHLKRVRRLNYNVYPLI